MILTSPFLISGEFCLRFPILDFSTPWTRRLFLKQPCYHCKIQEISIPKQVVGEEEEEVRQLINDFEKADEEMKRLIHQSQIVDDHDLL